MCTLAHILEAAGLATVLINQMRPFAARMRPPRALYAEFPLGRPLGRPRDPAYQRSVLDAALALLDRAEGPVLADFPDVIADTGDEPLACPLPPRYDPSVPPAVAEVRGLRSAWERTHAGSGRTQVGRRFGVDDLADAADRLVQVAESRDWRDAFASEDDLRSAVSDIRSYYEEAALALAEHVPAARAVESWFFHSTEMGAVVRRLFDAAMAEESAFDASTGPVLLPYSQAGDRLPPPGQPSAGMASGRGRGRAGVGGS